MRNKQTEQKRQDGQAVNVSEAISRLHRQSRTTHIYISEFCNVLYYRNTSRSRREGDVGVEKWRLVKVYVAPWSGVEVYR